MRTKRSLRARWQSFRNRKPFAGILVIIGVIFVVIAIGGAIGYTTYDYTQNNPNFCNSCHIMDESFKKWETSEHAGINCHECHHLNPQEGVQLLVSFLSGTEQIPERHGKVIVPWKYCIGCHWEEKEEHARAIKINSSRLHAKHYFMEQIECSKCHGYRLHNFTLEERYCVTCHENRDVHGKGMEKFACLNCHTDQTVDLKPGRNKCLFCHGDESVREDLIRAGSLDVTHYTPSKELIEKAENINGIENVPMKFACYECHNVHDAENVRPTDEACIRCHPSIAKVGRHEFHVESMGLECTTCHKPHLWSVTKEIVEDACSGCHDEPLDPVSFIGVQEET